MLSGLGGGSASVVPTNDPDVEAPPQNDNLSSAVVNTVNTT